MQAQVLNKIGSVFIPVNDIEKARDWYCALLEISPETCEVVHGRSCLIPMQGADIMLDTMPMWGGQEPGGPPPIQSPVLMLLSEDLQASYRFLRDRGDHLVTNIQDDTWFVIKDPFGNKLMICRN